MSKPKHKRSLQSKVSYILRRLDTLHSRFYAVKTFGGPSLHFHRRALGFEGQVSAEQQAELVYAALTSWGMHRMGSGGSKMVPYEVFREAIRNLTPQIQAATEIDPAGMTARDWALLEKIFCGIKVMATKTSVVGHSKVMAHFIPNAIAPVDRQYTLRYLFGNGSIRNGLAGEWRLLRKIHEEFFYPIVANADFQKQASQWMANQAQWQWDTSSLKIADNLVIGALN